MYRTYSHGTNGVYFTARVIKIYCQWFYTKVVEKMLLLINLDSPAKILGVGEIPAN